MRTNRRDIVLRKITQSRRVARWPETPGPDGPRRNRWLDPALLDWDHAVRTAAVRLAGHDALPDNVIHPLLRGQAEWLAALLTAFGKLADEVDRLPERTDEPCRPAAA
jgi:hypothetical protein